MLFISSQATGATTGPTLTKTTGSSGNQFQLDSDKRKEDEKLRSNGKKNAVQNKNQTKNKNVFSFDANADGVTNAMDMNFEKERAPSIADIISESIAESIEIVDDEENDKNINESDVLVHDNDDDDDSTIRNEPNEKLKVPKAISSMDSIRRESQDTVIFAPKESSSGTRETGIA